VHPALAGHGACGACWCWAAETVWRCARSCATRASSSVTLVELDEQVTRLARSPVLARLNGDALRTRRCSWCMPTPMPGWSDTASPQGFDVVIADFPDPSNHQLAKLYSTSFYQRVMEHLNAGGYLVVQSTSPLVAPHSFWTVVDTLEAVGLRHHAVPRQRAQLRRMGLRAGRPSTLGDTLEQLPAGLRFLTPETLPLMMSFPPDMARVPGGVNRLRPGAGAAFPA
jgi:spermidine synthase